MKKIISINIDRPYDEFPDTSYLGEYTDKLDDWVIDRQEGEFVFLLNQPDPNCDACDDYTLSYGEQTPCNEHEYTPPHKGRDYRFFKSSSNHVPHNPRSWAHITDPDTLMAIALQHGSFKNADLHYARQNFRRMESLNNGTWYYIGVRAKAEIEVNGVPQIIQSPGIWGVESDCKDYIKDLEQDELSALKDQLKEIGFSKSQIKKAFDEVNYA